MLTPAHWIAIPLLGGVIGYITNRLAVKMIFRPLRPVNVFGLRVQGLMPRRQQDLAEKIGRVVGDHLVQKEDLIQAMGEFDLRSLLDKLLREGMAQKVAELRAMPLIGAFLTDDRVNDLQQALIDGILEHEAEIFETLEQAVEKGLDVPKLVTEKVASFPMERLEELVLQVASQELRAIEILGGVLGLIIGVGQVALLTVLE